MNFLICKEDYTDLKADALCRLEDLAKGSDYFSSLMDLFESDKYFSKLFSAIVLNVVNQRFYNGTYFSAFEIVDEFLDDFKGSVEETRQVQWVFNELLHSITVLLSCGNMYVHGNLYRVDVLTVDRQVMGVIGRLVLPEETAVAFGDRIDLTSLVDDIRISIGV